MNITQLDQELRSGKIRPFYIITGEERYLALTAKDLILKEITRSAMVERDLFEMGKNSIHEVLDCLKTPPMLSPWRFVLLEGGEKLKKGDWDPLKEYFGKKREKQTLILMGENIRSNYLKNLPQGSAVLECKTLYPNMLAGWVNMESRRRGLSISREAALFLIDSVGSNLGELHQALEKTALFVGEKRLIELKDIEAVVSRTSQRSIFDLTRSIGEQKPSLALQYLHQILEEGEEPVRTLAMISRHFRLLAKAQGLLSLSNGRMGSDFAKELKVHPFFAKEYASQATRYKSSVWPEKFQALLACDKALKSSKNKPGVILEKLILELMGKTLQC